MALQDFNAPFNYGLFHRRPPTPPSATHIQLITPLQQAIQDVNATIAKRKRNNRDNITQALRGGRLCVEVLKPLVKYGEWETWVVANTDYATSRAATNDMQFWLHWKEHIAGLVKSGIIHDITAPENELVNTLDDELVAVSLSAMQEFMRKGVPDLALKMALESLQSGKATELTAKGARRVVDAAKAIEQLPKDAQAVAQELYVTHGLDNPELIAELPSLMEHQEVLSEIKSSGHIFVPGVDNGNGRQVAISNASRTDLELALGRNDIEEELAKQQATKKGLSERKAVSESWDWIENIEGTPEQLIHMLKLKMDKNAVYRVSLSISKQVVSYDDNYDYEAQKEGENG